MCVVNRDILALLLRGIATVRRSGRHCAIFVACGEARKQGVFGAQMCIDTDIVLVDVVWIIQGSDVVDSWQGGWSRGRKQAGGNHLGRYWIDSRNLVVRERHARRRVIDREVGRKVSFELRRSRKNAEPVGYDMRTNAFVVGEEEQLVSAID